MITKEQYECAKHTVQFYNSNPVIREYMDDEERKSYQEALRIIDIYTKQVKQNNITRKTQEITK